MGGSGSGRQAGYQAPQCHQYCAIDLAWLRRKKLLRPGLCVDLNWKVRGEPSGMITLTVAAKGVLLRYRTRTKGEEWRNIEEPIAFCWTGTAYKGRRAWFQCPGCGRRCRILYGGSLFRCRRCHGLKFESQYESAYSRGTSRACALRRRLGHTGDLDEPFPAKPKGMHWKTYRRLEALDDDLQRRWAGDLITWMSQRIPRRV